MDKSACLRVFTNSLGYNQRRNYADLPFKRYRIEKHADVTRIPIQISYRVFGKLPVHLQNSHLCFPLTQRAVHHLFNAVSFSRVPWVSTFETIIPRWKESPRWYTRMALEAISSDWCLGIIGFSECSKQIQDRFLTDEFPEYRETIINKCIALHPAQKPVLRDYSEKRAERGLRLLLVGNQIFSKGGREVVRAVRRLADEGADIKVRIVSALQPDNYATLTTDADVGKFRRELEVAAGPVEFLGKVPNERVLSLLMESHVALLPTCADTYGYFVLEAQANGCPVISTNIRALPEINNAECGWLINVPLNERRDAQLASTKKRLAVSEAIEAGLEKCLRECLDDPNCIERKGRLAIQRIALKHRPEDRVTTLEAIYDQGMELLS